MMRKDCYLSSHLNTTLLLSKQEMINHLHVHIIPRRKGDFKNNDDIYPLIEKFDEK